MTEREAAHEAVRGIWKAAAGLPKGSAFRAWLMGLRKDVQGHMELLPPERPSRLRRWHRVVLPLAFAATASSLALSLVNSTSEVVGEPGHTHEDDVSAITQALADVEKAQRKIQRQHKKIMSAGMEKPKPEPKPSPPKPEPASPTPAPAPESSVAPAPPNPAPVPKRAPVAPPPTTEPQHPGNGKALGKGPPPGKGWRK